MDFREWKWLNENRMIETNGYPVPEGISEAVARCRQESPDPGAKQGLFPAGNSGAHC